MSNDPPNAPPRKAPGWTALLITAVVIAGCMVLAYFGIIPPAITSAVLRAANYLGNFV